MLKKDYTVAQMSCKKYLQLKEFIQSLFRIPQVGLDPQTLFQIFNLYLE